MCVAGGNEPLTSTPASKSSYKPISAAIKTPFVPLPKHQQQLYMQEQQQHHQQQQNIGTAAPYNREKYQSEGVYFVMKVTIVEVIFSRDSL